MKQDIDFDELDKAVNSLMGGLKAKPDQPAPKTLNITSTLKENEKPEYTKLEQVAKKIGSETILSPVENTAILPGGDIAESPKTLELAMPVPAPVDTPAVPTQSLRSEPPAPLPVSSARSARPSGRFMDVMHPSSDMKTKTAAPSSSPRPARPISTISREGVTIAPPKAMPEPTPREPVPVMPKLAEPEMVSVPEAAPMPSADAPVETPASPEPLSSPFLPDAKVEKRPLGGVPSSQDMDLPSSNIDDTDAQVAPDATALEEQLPEELHGDLLAIESNFADTESPVEVSDVNQHFDVPAAEEMPESVSGAEVSEPVANNSDASGPVSIAKQYKELPSSGDPSSGSIYDVEQYHQPVSHPAKTTSGWLWVVIIVLIIVVCGGGAAAFYLMSTK